MTTDTIEYKQQEKTHVWHANNAPLNECVKHALENYFGQMGKECDVKNLYQLVLSEIEVPLLEATMKYTRGNQSKAAILMGLSRGTLRKKLKIYNME